jgi:GNAT superfamily N-acetyltransferase
MYDVIRDAHPRDARRMEEIRVAGWKTAYSHLIDPEWLAELTVTQERISSWQQRVTEAAAGSVMLVAEDQGEIVGFAVLLPSRDDDMPDAAELLALYVDPVRRFSGVGTALLRAGFDRMRQPVQILWVLQGNAPARRFYERHGFVADGATKEHHSPGNPVEVRYRRLRLG